jgi:hypothetical protein
MNARARIGRCSARGVLLATLVVAPLAGCFSDPTEVVVVVDTDATPRDFQQITFTIGTSMQQVAFANPTPMPVTLGLTPNPGSPTTFELVVTFNNMDSHTGGSFFLRRAVSNIHFVSDEMRTLFIPMLSVCTCNGTNCPHALDDECRDITAPVLTAFDENNLPHLSKAPTATP